MSEQSEFKDRKFLPEVDQATIVPGRARSMPEDQPTQASTELETSAENPSTEQPSTEELPHGTPGMKEILERDVRLELERFNQALSKGVKLTRGEDKLQGNAAQCHDEPGENEVQLLQKVDGLQADLHEMAGRLDSLEKLVREGNRNHGRELQAIRDELLGERRALAAADVFEKIIGPLEQFRRMRRGLHPSKDERVRIQLEAIINILDRAILLMGFEQFEARENEPFDPQRMVCRGYLEGEAGVVLRALNAGYRLGQIVMHPAEVMIADPLATVPDRDSGGNDK